MKAFTMMKPVFIFIAVALSLGSCGLAQKRVTGFGGAFESGNTETVVRSTAAQLTHDTVSTTAAPETPVMVMPALDAGQQNVRAVEATHQQGHQKHHVATSKKAGLQGKAATWAVKKVSSKLSHKLFRKQDPGEMGQIVGGIFEGLLEGLLLLVALGAGIYGIVLWIQLIPVLTAASGLGLFQIFLFAFNSELWFDVSMTAAIALFVGLCATFGFISAADASDSVLLWVLAAVLLFMLSTMWPQLLLIIALLLLALLLGALGLI